MKNNIVTVCENILQVEGVLSKGYGFSPQMVMRDKRLTPEAKCIYAYIASFAGAGVTAFPSVQLICDELSMSEKRYRKHFNLLKKYDYLRVEREKIPGQNLYGNNIYTLVQKPESAQKPEADPDPVKTAGTEGDTRSGQNDHIGEKEQKSDPVKTTGTEEEARSGQNDHVGKNVENPDEVKSAVSARYGRFGCVQDDRTKSNIYQKIDRSIHLSGGRDRYVNKKIKTMDRQDGWDGQDVREKFKKQIEIDALLAETEEEEKKSLIYWIFEAIIDLYNTERAQINGSFKDKAAITAALEKLGKVHMQYIIQGVSSNKKPVKNKRAYIQSCIYNSAFDTGIEMSVDKTADQPVPACKPRLVEEQEDKESQLNDLSLRAQKVCEKIPEIRDLTEGIESRQRELSKVILLRNGQDEILRKEIENLRDSRSRVLKKYGYTPDFIKYDAGS